MNSLRELGNERFRAGDFGGAEAAYTAALEAGTHAGSSAATLAASVPRAAPTCDDAAGLAHVVVGIDEPTRKSLATLFSNRAQARLKLGDGRGAVHDGTLALALDDGNAKALFRRAQAYEALGALPAAVKDATRLLSMPGGTVSAWDMLSRLRAAAAGAPVAVPQASASVPAATGGAASGAAAVVSRAPPAASPLGLADCLALLARSRPPSPAPSRADALHVVRSLAAHLEVPSPARAFLQAGGPADLLRMCALAAAVEPAPPAPPAPAGGGPSPPASSPLTAALNLLLQACDRVVQGGWAEGWEREWEASPEEAPPGVVPLAPQQRRVMVSLLGPLLAPAGGDRGVLLALLPEGPPPRSASALGPFHAAMRVACALLLGAWRCICGPMEADGARRRADWKAVKEGRLSVTPPLPAPFRDALGQWAARVAAVLHAPPPLVMQPRDRGYAPLPEHTALVRTCLDAIGLLGSGPAWEGGVNVLRAGGVLEGVSKHAVGPQEEEGAVSAEASTEARNRALAALARILRTLRDSHAKGGLEEGRKKLRGLVQGLVEPLISDLGSALPLAPAAPEGADFDGAVPPLPAPPPRADWSYQHGLSRALAAVQAALLVDRRAGLSLLTEIPGLLPAVFVVSAAPHPVAQLLACDVVSLLCGDEEGRSVLGTAAQGLHPEVLAADPSIPARLALPNLLRRLGESPLPAVRTGASVLLAKLTAAPLKGAGLGGGAQASLVPGGAAAGGGSAGTEVSPEAAVRAAESARLVAARDEVAGRVLVQLRRAAGLGIGAESDGDDDGEDGEEAVPAPLPPFRALLQQARGKAPAAAQCEGAPLPVRGCDLPSAVRAVESLAVVATQTRNKGAVAAPACTQALLRIAAALTAALEAQHSGEGGAAWGAGAGAELRPAALGLVHCLLSVVTSQQEAVEARLREMDVDPEQFKALQKAAAVPGSDPLAGQEADPSEAVEARVRALLLPDSPSAKAAGKRSVPPRMDVVHMLAALAAAVKGSGDDDADARTRRGSGSASASETDASQRGAPTRALISHFLLQCAAFPWARGKLLAAGCLPLLLELATSRVAPPKAATTSEAVSSGAANTHEGALAAAQAMARLLINTNPALLPQPHLLDAVSPLLRLAREAPSQQAQNEAGMAVTTLLAAGEEAREQVLRRGGLDALEGLQFADHPLLRRTGTEGLCNASSHPRAAQLIVGRRLRLWLALCRAFTPPAASHGADTAGEGGTEGDRDTATALAASGGLAGAILRLTGAGDAALLVAGAVAYVRGEGVSAAARGGEGGDMEAAAEADQCVRRFIACGGVRALSELLMAGPSSAGLPHRAAATLAAIAGHPLAAAAMLSPLQVDGEGEGEVDAAAKGPPTSSPALAPSAFVLLALLARGRDPGTVQSGGDGRAASAAAARAVPAQSAAQQAARAILAHCARDEAWARLQAVADRYNGQVRERQAAAVAPAGTGGGSAAAAAGAAEPASPSLPDDDTVPEVGTAELQPRRPDAALVTRILAELPVDSAEED